MLEVLNITADDGDGDDADDEANADDVENVADCDALISYLHCPALPCLEKLDIDDEDDVAYDGDDFLYFSCSAGLPSPLSFADADDVVDDVDDDADDNHADAFFPFSLPPSSFSPSSP